MANVSPIPFYLDVLSQWPSSISNESQWFVYIPFDDVLPLKNNAFETIKRYETGSGSGSQSWESSQTLINTLTRKQFQEHLPHLGCVFASSVTIPNESVTASNQGLKYAGFQAPATMDYRNPQGTFSIKFIETNMSFVDFVLRPWTILVGHYGFVTREDNSKNVKAPYIDVVYLGKSGAFQSAPIKRKIIRFHNVAPIKVQGFTNQYSSNAMQSSTVDFIYDYYSIEGTESNTSANINESSGKVPK